MSGLVFPHLTPSRFNARSTNSTDNPASVAALSATTSSFLTALATNSIVAGAELAVWLVIRRQFKAIYEPRSYMPDVPRRVDGLTSSFLGVFWKIWLADPREILEKNGIDAYVYVRFLRMMVQMFVPIWAISWLVLLPLDSVNTAVPGKSGLDMFTFGNIDPTKQHRLWGHLILAWAFVFWICYLIQYEMKQWIGIRQRHLINPSHSRLAQANTVLITGIDKDLLDEERLAQLFSHLPGGAKYIWLNRDLKEMPGLHDRRITATKKLENAQVKMTKIAAKLKAKRDKEIAKLGRKGKPIPAALLEPPPVNPDIEVKGETSPSVTALVAIGGKDVIKPQQVLFADTIVPRSSRPTHRLPTKLLPFSLPFMGQKVDTVDWARAEIINTGKELEKSRQVLAADIAKPGTDGETYPPLNSAFVYFNQQIAAHMASQITLHDRPYRMSGHHIEVSPHDIIWRNLSLNPYEAFVRQIISYAITAGLVLLWSIPVAFLGALSNATQLCLTYRWMQWLCNLNNVVQGIITGVLPPVLLGLVNLLLPMILRQLAAFEGIPRNTGVELSLMTRYFVLLVLNSFIILTLSASIITTVPQIAKDPGSSATILAQQLPKASTFFITYITLQAAGVAANLLQIVTLVLYYVQLIFLGGTPRNAYHKKYNMSTPDWGLTFPATTLLTVMTIAYMIISPVINGLAMVAFLLNYHTQKYLFIWVIDQPAYNDTGGLFFPKAMNHIFVGVYISEVCLCALFFLARDQYDNVAALPQAIIMIVLVLVTIAFHYVIYTSYKSLISSLPLTLAYKAFGMPTENHSEERIIGDPKDDEFVGEKAKRNSKGAPPSGGQSDGRTSESSEQWVLAPEAPEVPGVELSTFPASPNTPHTPSKRQFNPLTLGPVALKTVGQTVGRGLVPVEKLAGKLQTKALGAEQIGIHEEETMADVIVDENGRESFRKDAFSHPATKEPQRIVWLPEDAIGLAKAEIEGNLSIGIPSTSKDAILKPNGRVDVEGPPPDDYDHFS